MEGLSHSIVKRIRPLVSYDLGGLQTDLGPGESLGFGVSRQLGAECRPKITESDINYVMVTFFVVPTKDYDDFRKHIHETEDHTRKVGFFMDYQAFEEIHLVILVKFIFEEVRFCAPRQGLQVEWVSYGKSSSSPIGQAFVRDGEKSA